MADTRCANPAYQLDVDVMMLDYLLYNAIRTQIESFELASKTVEYVDGESSVRENSEKASRLLSIFDSFISLFKLNHPDYEFPATLDFNIKLLEFILLFTNRRTNQLSQQSLASHHLSHLVNLRHRKRWLGRRKGVRVDESAEQYLHDDLLRTWSDFNISRLVTTSCPSPPLASLLPYFLTLSATAAEWRDHDLTEKWMELAATLMLSAAMEGLSVGNDIAGKSGMATIEEAFAYGYVPPEVKQENGEDGDHAMLDAAEDEEESDTNSVLVRMFIDDNPDLTGDQEISTWTETRQRYLKFFQTAPELKRIHLERLEIQFPLREVEQQVMAFASSLWKSVGNANENGLPMLVQIERRNVQGLDEEGFRGFMEKVGLDGHDSLVKKIEVAAREPTKRERA